MLEFENFDWDNIWNGVKESVGKVNILLIGKTGVGKSTLINSVFGEELAEVGVGKPVSQFFREYTKEDYVYTLIDSKGLEMKNYDQISQDICSLVASRKTNDPKEHVHIAWYCISDEGKRIEDGEIKIINDIADSIPVIIVLTKSIRKNDDGFADKIWTLCPNAKQVVRVLAQDYIVDDDCTIKARGLDKLVEVTNELLPEAARNAFAASQKVDWSIKISRAHKVVAGAVTLAVGTGATPIPFSDALILSGIQITMLGSISIVMGLQLDKAFLASLVSAAIGVSGAVIVGKTFVSNLLKMIPGAGSVVGGVISAGTAGTLTTVMGEAYIATLYRLLTSGKKNITTSDIAEEFKISMKNRDKVQEE